MSGSESSSGGSEDSDSDAVTSLVKKNKDLAPISEEGEGHSRSIPLSAIIWFHSPPSTQIGVYRSIFDSGAGPDTYLPELQNIQHDGDHDRTWAMFMVAGGHFAGAIVRVSKSVEQRAQEVHENEMRAKKGKQKRYYPETEVVKHKTFHRYTSELRHLLSDWWFTCS